MSASPLAPPPSARLVSLVTFGEYARHDGVATLVAIDPATGALPPRLLCTGCEPGDLRAIYAAEPDPEGPGVLLYREPKTPADHENPKTEWRYVQRPCKPEPPQ